MNAKGLQAFAQAGRHLSTAVSTSRLYAPDHPQVAKLLREARACLLTALAGEKSLAMLRIDEQLVVNQFPLPRSLHLERLARLLKESGIGYIHFRPNLDSEELHALVTRLAKGGAVAFSSENLRLGQVEIRHRTPAGSSGNEGSVLAAADLSASGDPDLNSGSAGAGIDALLASSGILAEVSSEELARIMEIYEAVRKKRRLQVVSLSDIVTRFIDVFAGHADPLLAMAHLRSMDEYTFVHSLNVCLLNLAQAIALGINGQMLHDIGLAAMLHDIGKLFIPVDVITKPDKLDDGEWQLMQTHPLRGAEYLLRCPGVPRLAVVNAYEHHMRYDRKGYPQSSAAWQQNLCSQLTTISDVFDALSTRRSYRKPLQNHEILDLLTAEKGRQLNPLLVDNFLQMMQTSGKNPGHEVRRP